MSLSAWLEPLQCLLSSVRRTASNMVSDALDNTEPGRGRLAKIARQIDLEIASIRDGCVQVDFVITGGEPDEQAGLFPHLPEDLPARTVNRLLLDIEQESHGNMSNASIRKYLQALPDGITHHSYELRQDDHLVTRVEVHDTRLAEVPAALPGLLHIQGRVIGVSFEPLSVTLKSESKKLTCSASQEQVDDAIRWRANDVEAMCLDTDKTRLLWLRPQGTTPGKPDGDERKARFLADWPHTLEILSK